MKTNYCSTCGAKISQKARFCGECGSKIERITESPENKSKQCSNCNYTSEGDEIYCPDCGTKLIGGGKENESSKQAQRPPIKKVSEPLTKVTPKSVKKKKGGFFRTLGKVALWIIAFLIVAIVALYFIGDNIDSTDTAQEFLQDESLQNISEEEMRLPTIKVRQANEKLTETAKFKVLAASEPQVFTYSDNIRVSLAPNFTSKEQSLSISKAEVDPAVYVEDALPVSIIDLTLNGGAQPAKPVEVAFTYDPGILNSAFTAEEQLEAYRWDEAGGGWVSLPMRFDDSAHTVYALVDHFSPSGLFRKIFEVSEVFVDELKAIKLAKKAADALDKGITELEENILNTCYITPEKNFKILYSKESVENNPITEDRAWNYQFTRSGFNYSKEHPFYIQDLGFFLESSLEIYVNTLKMKNPAGTVKGYFGTYKQIVKVKIDSYFSKVSAKENPFSSSSQGLPGYEKIFETIHIPTMSANSSDFAKTVLAHELFHRMQAEYYGVIGMLNPFNTWFLEATAEYAAYAVAWPSQINELDSGLGNNYLHYSIDDKGVKKSSGHYGWTDREYEYITSLWIKYLIDNGSNLKEMVVYDASDYKFPIYSLLSYLPENKLGYIGSVYRNFVHEMMFARDGSLNSYLNSTKGGKDKRDLAIKNSALILGKKNETSYTFEMPYNFTSHLWAISLDKQKSNTKVKKSPVIVEVKDKTVGLTIDVFLLPKGKSFIDPPKPVKTIYTEDTSEIIMVEEGDVLCVVSTQGRFTAGKAEVIVSDASVQLEVNPPELLDAVSNRAYPFEITAENIPKKIEKVKFEWDFGDGKKNSQGFKTGVAVSSETAELKIQHQYDDVDKEETYPLKIVLKDDATGLTLATKEVTVTVPMKKPTVLISATHFVGPPGATFDMEALASPKSTYRFVWQVDGMAEAYQQVGEKSGIAPIISKKGQYNVVVKLYSTDNTYLASDNATITVEEEELNTEGIEGIVDIDEGIKESVQKAWVLTETKLDNKADRLIRKNKSYKNVYTFKQNLSNNSLYCEQTFIGKTDTYYNPAKENGEGLGAQFNWTGPPKFINPGDKITLQLNGKVVSENLSFYGFGFQIGAGACIYKKGADDANWCESFRNAEGKSSQACNKKKRSFSEKVSVDKIPKGDKDEILIINVGGGIEGARTKYIYEWK